MSNDRLERIRRRLAGDDDRSLDTARLCEVCAEITELSGAGIMLMDGDLAQGSVCTTNAVSALIEELQFTLGEGPCVDAYFERRPVVEPDLANPAQPRWTAFTPPAIEAGVRAMFGFPLDIGGARLGAVNFYRDRPGPLSSDQYLDALVMAAVAAQAVIGMQVGAAHGALGAELEIGTNFQFAVHQASGMVAVQLGVNVTDALVRLRAHAFRDGRLVADVANDVIDGRLRFNQSDD